MSTTLPTRAQVESAPALDFAPKPTTTITISGVCQGWPIAITFTGKLEALPGYLERLSAAGVTPASPTAAPAPPQRTKRPKVTPLYADDGEPMCPVHKRPLKEGKFGPYCSARDDGPDSKNGYCGLAFDA